MENKINGERPPENGMNGFQTVFCQPKEGKPTEPITALMTAAVLSALSLNVCSGSEKSIGIQEQTEARFQLNSHPKQAYCPRTKISDVPGPSRLMGNFGAGYKVENCSYIINRIEGAFTSPEKNVEIKIRQLGEFEYETVVYVDATLDEDYSGEGICHWKPDGLGVAFKAIGHPEETKFNFGDFLDDLMEKKTLTKCYWKWSYPYSKRENGTLYSDSADFGIISPEICGAEQHREMFATIVTLEEVQP